MVWKSLNSVSKLASMIPNPKDPLAPPVSLKSQIFSREVMSTTELISAKLRYEVESKGLQEYIEELPSVGVYDYHLFSQLLDRSVFPEELCSRFENFCKRQENLEEALPAILLYQFLFPYLRKQTGYPTDDKPGIWVERVVKVPSRLQVKTDRVINFINWPRVSRPELLSSIHNFVASLGLTDNDLVFFRTTDWEHAITDLSVGFKEISKIEAFLEFGWGVYFSQDPEYILECYKNCKPLIENGLSLSIFVVPQSILTEMSGDIIKDYDYWRNIVVDQLKYKDPPETDYILSYACGNTVKVPSCSEPTVKKIGPKIQNQLCIKSRANANLFLKAARVYVINVFGQ